LLRLVVAGNLDNQLHARSALNRLGSPCPLARRAAMRRGVSAGGR
jgi:hypothetical protein